MLSALFRTRRPIGGDKRKDSKFSNPRIVSSSVNPVSLLLLLLMDRLDERTNLRPLTVLDDVAKPAARLHNQE